MSDGSELWGGTWRGLGRGAGRGTAEASAGALVGSGFEIVGDGLGDLAGTDLSVCFDLGVGSSFSDFFFGDAVALALGFGFGVTSSSSADFFAGDFFGFGVGESSPSSLPAGVFFVFGLAVGVGDAFDFDFRLAGFGVAFGSGVSEGVGDVTARISSLGFFFLGSSLV